MIFLIMDRFNTMNTFYRNRAAAMVNINRFWPMLLSTVLLVVFANLLSVQSVNAWSPMDLLGPSVRDVTYSYRVSNGIFYLSLTNKSDYYIETATLLCDTFDTDRNRIEKEKEVTFGGVSDIPAIAPGNTVTWAEMQLDFRPIALRNRRFARSDCELIRVTGKK